MTVYALRLRKREIRQGFAVFILLIRLSLFLLLHDRGFDP